MCRRKTPAKKGAPIKISDRLLSHFAFLSVGIVSLVLAVFMASQLTKRSHSQTPPTEQSLPAQETPAQETIPQEEPSAQEMESQPQEMEPPASDTSSEEALSAEAVPLTADTFLEPYIYDMRDGRRNPFKPPTTIDGGSAESLLPGTPLERYDINELKLIGIMWDVKNPKAMFQDPSGTVHILAKDDRIGRRRGYVAMIREGEVVVVETTIYGNENQLATTILRIDK